MEGGGKRPIVFHRWGGLGNHRYQIGFSGDTIAVWDSLAFQPYFTATAANVGYGYWSHDIGGPTRTGARAERTGERRGGGGVLCFSVVWRLGPRSPSSRTARPPPRMSATATGATISAATCARASAR